MKTRKPTMKDISKGVLAFSLELLKGIFTFNIPRIQFSYFMIITTLKGNFEVEDD